MNFFKLKKIFFDVNQAKNNNYSLFSFFKKQNSNAERNINSMG